MFKKSLLCAVFLFWVFFGFFPCLWAMSGEEAPNPAMIHEQAEEQARYYQDQQRINALERQNLSLKAENEDLKKPDPPRHPTKEERKKTRYEASMQALEAKNAEITHFCRRLLWNCQLPRAAKAACQKFTENCAGLEKTIGEMRFSDPIDLPLGETEQFRPVGYVTPQGLVKGVHKNNLGYAVPGDIDSALLMAATANLQDHDVLPDHFPRTSPKHPYRAGSEERRQLHQEMLPHRNECGLLLDQCVTLNTESAECFSGYNKTCGRHIPYLAILKHLEQQRACGNYKINSNIEPLKRLQMLRDCGRDPTNDPKDSVYMAITDCHSLNLLCQVKQNKMPYCQAFIEGECLAGKKNKVKKLLPHEMPFWAPPDPTRTLMSHPQTQWPDCSQEGNIVLETSHGMKEYFLGRINENGFLSLYHEGEILENIAQVTPKGHLIKKIGNAQAKAILSHFKKIEHIASDGTLWQCHQTNKPEKIERFLTPTGGLFTVKRDWNGNLIYDGKAGFEKTEQETMRRHNSLKSEKEMT